MKSAVNLMAIGRSRLLYDAITHLGSKGYSFKAIVTDEAYEEYDVKHQDFERLAGEIGARFIMTKTLQVDEISPIIRANDIRVAISANWKYTISQQILDLFERGILNFHLGNLPDYKGNATVNWAIINGENHIDGNVHKMDPELDAGDIISRKAIPIGPLTYVGDILKQAEHDAPLLYEDAVERILKDSQACLEKGSIHGLRCYPRLPEDSQINWNDSVENICRLVRASARPYKGAFSYVDETKVTIWKASTVYAKEKYLAIPGHVISVYKNNGTIWVACPDGFLEIHEIECEGNVMRPTDFIKSIRSRFKYRSGDHAKR
jgi:methionyl-tRNA formyltransferase